ncbi:cation-translocating P-type ATPase [Promethearchaeum syntrophicum]|uniref:Cation-translocating P-type ATPase n=1 Tax=Promethearchaeum syntrophicum TaxID=2594042 RepID=A0A5B9DG86_9ARCH|nr:cation-translocating P-type ATPase [Candidatus Prometheoarchaeum syntrophicum]QEE18065.1 putative copper-exporting P-type ATPase A [Candidatus Prometheoarchaeum syntrophicum]
MENQEIVEEIPIEPEINWFTLSKEEVEKNLSTSSNSGLSSAEVKTRFEKYGPNELKAEEKRPRWKVFLDQFKDVLIYILIFSAIISAVFNFIEYGSLGDDWIVIAVIVVLNAIIGFIQEGKADEAIEALKNFAAPESQVIRDGKEITVKARELVPGDLIVLHEGDMLPADGRIIEQSNLKVEEAALTGESVPVNKQSNIIEDVECPLAERKNMVFSSTLATYGRGKAIITETGMKTEVGKIATMISEAEDKMTPLQKNLEDFGVWLGKIILLICVAVSLVYIARFLWFGASFGIMESILAGVALAVAAIPEGLPAVVSVCLAIGVTRMSEQNAIIKKLHSVETLGCTSVICSDKTGTLTKNEMTVRSAWAGGKIYDFTGSGYAPEGKILLEGSEIQTASIPDLDLTLKIGLLCNNARLNQDEKTKKWNTFGDPTEGCLITSAWKAGMEHATYQKKFPRLDEIPFDSTRKRMTVIHEIEGKKIAYVKGATEILLDLCNNIQIDGQNRPITAEDKKQILEAYEQKADEALRGLGFAYRDAEGIKVEVEEMEKDLTFIGMQFMIDPPRDEVKVAIKECKQAGIGVKMITGDNLITATAIARELGMVNPGEITHQGKDIPDMSDDDISDCHVFARVSPEHKQNIVKALQNKGFVVAMTGDGVNDAPALKNADVGVAMGITGTDVSKEAAVMVLADDNFATIVHAVEEGRGIYDNIKKFIQYLLSSNVMEVLVLFIASFFLPPPLVATQLLWINLVTDGAPAVALGFDPYDPTLMKQKPRPIDEPLLTKNFIITMLYRGVILTALILGIYILYDRVTGFMPTEVPDGFRDLIYEFEDLIDTEGVKTNLIIKYDSESGLYQHLLESGVPVEDMEEALLLDRYILWKARSVTFLVMMVAEMSNAFNCRSEYNSLFKIGFFKNKPMLFSVGISVVLTILLYFWRGLGNIFSVIPLDAVDWLWVIPSIIVTIGCVEILKIYFRKQLHL